MKVEVKGPREGATSPSFSLIPESSADRALLEFFVRPSMDTDARLYASGTSMKDGISLVHVQWLTRPRGQDAIDLQKANAEVHRLFGVIADVRFAIETEAVQETLKGLQRLATAVEKIQKEVR